MTPGPREPRADDEPDDSEIVDEEFDPEDEEIVDEPDDSELVDDDPHPEITGRGAAAPRLLRA